MTRDEHLDWCKRRALAYVDAGDLRQAFASIISDLSKHPETKDHRMAEIGMSMLLAGHLESREQMRNFITGFR